jgi:hypothetical protein
VRLYIQFQNMGPLSSTLKLQIMQGKLSVFSASSYAMLVSYLRYLVHLITIQYIHLGLASLNKRRYIAIITFLAGVLNINIDSHVLLPLICLKVPSRSSRSETLFYVLHATTNYMASKPLKLLMSCVNADPAFNDLLSY